MAMADLLGGGTDRASRRVTARACAGLGIAALTLLAGGLMAGAASAQEGRLELFVNHAKIVKLAEPAATVIIGNDAIADATVKDATTLVLTGRAFGTTNLVILDEAGEPIVDERLIVRKDEGDTVRVFRPGGDTVNLSEFQCSPVCAIATTGADDGDG